jgi:hypothetical protein
MVIKGDIKIIYDQKQKIWNSNYVLKGISGENWVVSYWLVYMYWFDLFFQQWSESFVNLFRRLFDWLYNIESKLYKALKFGFSVPLVRYLPNK